MREKALRLVLGMVSASAALGVLLAAATLTAAPAGAFDPDHAVQTGVANLVSSGKFLRNWDCGCPDPENRPSVLNPPKDFDRNAYPARCFKENHSEILLKQKLPRPRNNAGQEWPSVQYPHGFPPTSTENPHPPTYDTIPFPGWPVRRSYDSTVVWDDTQRTKYRDWYKDNGTPPADEKKNPKGLTVPSSTSGSKKYRPGWQYYQIHHIFERRFGGENGKGNLVPAYSRRGFNQHQEYTTWWTQAKVDSDIEALKNKGNKQAKKIWAKISKCSP